MQQMWHTISMQVKIMVMISSLCPHLNLAPCLTRWTNQTSVKNASTFCCGDRPKFRPPPTNIAKRRKASWWRTRATGFAIICIYLCCLSAWLSWGWFSWGYGRWWEVNEIMHQLIVRTVQVSYKNGVHLRTPATSRLSSFLQQSLYSLTQYKYNVLFSVCVSVSRTASVPAVLKKVS